MVQEVREGEKWELGFVCHDFFTWKIDWDWEITNRKTNGTRILAQKGWKMKFKFGFVNRIYLPPAPLLHTHTTSLLGPSSREHKSW